MPEKNSVMERNIFDLRIGRSLASVICAIAPLPCLCAYRLLF